jgi:hypothetical protein
MEKDKIEKINIGYAWSSLFSATPLSIVTLSSASLLIVDTERRNYGEN